MEKLCTKCGITKDKEKDFYCKNGYYWSPCKKCHNDYDKTPVRKEKKRQHRAAYRAANPQKMYELYRAWKEKYPEGAREQYLKFRFKMSLQEYKDMLAAEGGVCFICRRPEEDKRRFSVDHDHRCCPKNEGKTCGQCVRGLLCQNCNALLGFAQDNLEILARAQDYLKRYARTPKTDAGNERQAGAILEQVPVSG